MVENLYRVHEVFRSIQGEGSSIGHDCVFVRLAGCNLACPFCDERHKAISWYSAQTIVDAVEALAGRGTRIVITGGEPLLQLDRELLDALKSTRRLLCLETNAAAATASAAPLPASALLELDEVVVSPKDAALDPGILAAATALKLLVDCEGTVVGAAQVFSALFDTIGSARPQPFERILQPLTLPLPHNLQITSPKALRLAASISEIYGAGWRVIPQVHVLMGLK